MIIIGVIIFLGIVPSVVKFQNDQNNLNIARDNLNSAQTKLTELNKLNKDADKTDTVKAKVLELLPDEKNTSDFIVKVESMTSSIPLIIQNFNLAEAKKSSAKTTTDTKDETGTSNSSTKSTTSDQTTDQSGNTSETKTDSGNSVEFTVSFKSDYKTIQDFLNKMEKFPRFNTIESLNLSGYNADTNFMDFKANGKIYYGK